jgi:DNA-binding response OmpR family regulator
MAGGVDTQGSKMFIAILETVGAPTSGLSRSLESAGHRVTRLAHTTALARHLELGPCDMLVLGQSAWRPLTGAAVLRSGEAHRIGVVVLMEQDGAESRIAALEGGADVCLASPVDPRILLATLNSLNRRIQDTREPHTGQSPSANAQRDAWRLLSRNWVLVAPDGKRIQLTATECALLSLLLSHAGKPVSRREIVTALGHDYRHYDERRLEALVSRLRRKLDHDTAMKPIRVAHGFGYAFTASGLVS